MDAQMIDSQIDSQNDKLQNADWVSKKLHIPVVSIYDYARRKIIPCVRVGKLVRFRPSDIERFINAGGQAKEGK